MSRIKGLALAVIALGVIGLATTPAHAAAAAKTAPSMCRFDFCPQNGQCIFSPTCWDEGCPPGCLNN